jgi:acyl-coenzyme A synthetase/AMP-(fatty) acid ligase
MRANAWRTSKFRREFCLFKDLPKGITGKVQRRALKEMPYAAA